LCRGIEVQSVPDKGKRRGGTTSLKGLEKTIANREGRTLLEEKEEGEGVAKRSSTPLSGALLGEIAPTRSERNT